MTQKTKMILVATIVTGAIILVILSVSKKQSKPASPAQKNGNEASQALAKPVSVKLAGVGNSKLSGTAVISSENNKVKVVLDLDGVAEDAVNPAHIHAGTCSNEGWIKYPLNFPKGGKSETVLDVAPSEFISQLPMVVDAHDSATTKTASTCGEIAN